MAISKHRGHRGGRGRRFKRREPWEAPKPADARDRAQDQARPTIIRSKEPVSERDHYQESHQPGYLDALAEEARQRGAR